MTGSVNIATRPGYFYSGLGITASHVRRISSGEQYDRFFPKTLGTDPIVNKNAEVHDTLHFVAEVVAKTLSDTKGITQVLKKPNLPASLRSIFAFFYDNYQYKLDKAGVEQVRRPARAWADRKKGIDCDCFTTSVSSILTNLGVAHYLKIIGIKNRPYYQHIYVVVPKFKGADINTRSNYWVIDPVLNNFDQEAPDITKKDHLAMNNVNGIPLQYLNGLGCPNKCGKYKSAVRGPRDNEKCLGKEFEGIEDLEGLGSVDDVFDGFRRRLVSHVRNTRTKVRSNPASVSLVYQPQVLEGMLGELEAALEGPEESLMGILEDLSNRENNALQPRFQEFGNAIHGHDDHLYGEMFGDVDDTMLGTVSGLGKKGKLKIAAKKANPAKKGIFTKVKNAVKKVAVVHKKIVQAHVKVAKKIGAKTKAVAKKVAKKAVPVLKKIGKIIVKTNPVAIAARGGFLVAMRTNFAKMAERAYWGYKTLAEAKAAGISEEYYKSCKELLAKILHVHVKVLMGEESAIKKAIMNGRAAKKIAKQMKGMGYSGSLSTLAGFGTLGSAAAAGSAVTAALAFLTPIMKWMSAKFKGKKGQKVDAEGEIVENENGTVEEAPTADNKEVDKMVREADSPSDSIVEKDGSVEAAMKANDEPPSNTQESESNSNTPSGSSNRASGSSNTPSGSSSASAAEEEAEEEAAGDGGKKSVIPTGGAKTAGGGVGTLLILGGLVALGLIATSKGKNKSGELKGLGNFSAKRESNTLKNQVQKHGLKLPHGYNVEKRKPTKVSKLKTLKLT